MTVSEKSSRGFADVHAHLYDKRFGATLEETAQYLERAKTHGVARCVCACASPGDWNRAAEIAKKLPDVFPAFGVHPWNCRRVSGDWLAPLANFLDAFVAYDGVTKAALGEVGLDFAVRGCDATRGKFPSRFIPCAPTKKFSPLFENIQTSPRGSCMDGARRPLKSRTPSKSALSSLFPRVLSQRTRTPCATSSRAYLAIGFSSSQTARLPCPPTATDRKREPRRVRRSRFRRATKKGLSSPSPRRSSRQRKRSPSFDACRSTTSSAS